MTNYDPYDDDYDDSDALDIVFGDVVPLEPWEVELFLIQFFSPEEIASFISQYNLYLGLEEIPEDETDKSSRPIVAVFFAHQDEVTGHLGEVTITVSPDEFFDAAHSKIHEHVEKSYEKAPIEDSQL